MIKTNVLIIGAGPTGLMAACQLQGLGIDYIILDKKEGPTRESRALVLHARSLEVYEQIGIAAEAVKQGEVLDRVQFIVNGRKIQELQLGSLGEGLSQFPYLLVLEQSKNEQLLYDKMSNGGGKVLWETEMLSLAKDENNCLAEVRNPQTSFSIQADWVIAADGGKSKVRHLQNVPFEGSTYEHIFYVADTTLDWPWGHESLSIYLSENNFLGLFPMKGQDRYRAIGILPVSFQNENPERFDQVTPFINKQMESPLHFGETEWFSVYRLHHRCVNNFRTGRVFFAGDAAHIHSPVGGQGMNTGLQDAYNLAWKLAYVIKGYANEHLLDTYNQERLPFARQLVATTDRAFSIITSEKWYNRWLRLYLFPLLIPFPLKFKKIRERAFRTVSQIGIKYTTSDITLNRVKQPLRIKAGERFPFLKTNEGQSLYQLMKEPCFYALIFQVSDGSFAEQMALLQNKFQFLKLLNLSNEKIMAGQLKVTSDTVILVRPDHYIGLVTDGGGRVVKNYLKALHK